MPEFKYLSNLIAPLSLGIIGILIIHYVGNNPFSLAIKWLIFIVLLMISLSYLKYKEKVDEILKQRYEEVLSVFLGLIFIVGIIYLLRHKIRFLFSEYLELFLGVIIGFIPALILTWYSVKKSNERMNKSIESSDTRLNTSLEHQRKINEMNWNVAALNIRNQMFWQKKIEIYFELQKFLSEMMKKSAKMRVEETKQMRMVNYKNLNAKYSKFFRQFKECMIDFYFGGKKSFMSLELKEEINNLNNALNKAIDYTTRKRIGNNLDSYIELYRIYRESDEEILKYKDKIFKLIEDEINSYLSD